VFDHVRIRVSDRAASERFYETVFAPLGIERTYAGEELVEWDDFSIAPADDEHPATHGRHVGFAARSRELADAFWRAGTGAGHRDDGAPGPRPQYGDDYYGAFLLDPDGNSAEAVHHDGLRSGGNIDHVWIRVSDGAASKRFYETIAPRSRRATRVPPRLLRRVRAGPRRQQHRARLPQPLDGRSRIIRALGTRLTKPGDARGRSPSWFRNRPSRRVGSPRGRWCPPTARS
jgi:catechol 2,3-dioxygenase-like lactoylglutathione lyase family enzyme